METPSDQSERHPVVEEYGRLASQYDAKWSFYVEAATRETLARLTLRPGERVLDVGCGTGAPLHSLSQRYPGAQLSGVDPVPEMLDVARHRLPLEVELRSGWAERLPFEGERFDVVVSCNAFHYFRDPVAALALRPDAAERLAGGLGRREERTSIRRSGEPPPTTGACWPVPQWWSSLQTGRRSLASPPHLANSTGTRTRLRKVEESSPPRITCAIGLWISLPGSPPASTSGISASPAVNAVISTGANRSCEP